MGERNGACHLQRRHSIYNDWRRQRQTDVIMTDTTMTIDKHKST
jgi:hypothetical protein